MSLQVTVSSDALRSAEDFRRRGLLVTAVPDANDSFEWRGGSTITWNEIARKFCVIPPYSWHMQDQATPVAQALDWFIERGVVLDGVASGGHLAVTTAHRIPVGMISATTYTDSRVVLSHLGLLGQ